MIFRVTIVFLFLTTLGIPTLLYSNIVPDKSYSIKDTISLNEVTVVSATKTVVNRNMVPLSVSVVDRQAIDQSTETGILSVLSEEVPGLYVTERGVTGYGISTGSAGTVSIHGVGGGNKVLMMFDGQPMWAGIFGHHVPDVYVSSDAERIEVIRGPGSLLYGSNAMGGVINVITRKAEEDGFHGGGRIMYGSYNTQKYLINSGYKKGKLNVYASLNRDRSDGQRKGSDFYINNGYLKLGYVISGNWNAQANAIVAKLKVHNPGTITWLMYDNWSKAFRSTYSLAINNQYEKMSGSVQMFYNNGEHEINDGYTATTNPRKYIFNSNDYNMGLAVFESFRLFENNLFTIGLDVKQWGGHAWNDSINGKREEIIDTHINEIAGYAVVQHTFFEKLTLNAGIRLEHNETYGKEWVPQAGLAYRLNSNSTFKTSFSKGFRSPNLRELYLYMPANPNLKPERMNNIDVSYLQSFFDYALQLEFTAYYAKGSNLITRAMVGGKPLNINTGKFINKGFDFSFTYRPISSLKINGNYSFLDSDIKLEGAPKHKMFLSFNWMIDKFTISPSVQYIHDLYLVPYSPDNAPEEVKIAGNYANYGLVNLRLSYKSINWATLFLNGENLTDTSYQTYNGFPMPGIVVMGGMEFKF